ncbi:unnamed protein product [Brachionus calyciflorus]|uniref:Uncharacterized protein n=1 Tax=Brachionus calyciflorus TaxID=104777 RepID=A0A814CH53_9BILA|nr:unnamed protein product [Brachionus calyciflorus]
MDKKINIKFGNEIISYNLDWLQSYEDGILSLFFCHSRFVLNKIDIDHNTNLSLWKSVDLAFQVAKKNSIRLGDRIAKIFVYFSQSWTQYQRNLNYSLSKLSYIYKINFRNFFTDELDELEFVKKATEFHDLKQNKFIIEQLRKSSLNLTRKKQQAYPNMTDDDKIAMKRIFQRNQLPT